MISSIQFLLALANDLVLELELLDCEANPEIKNPYANMEGLRKVGHMEKRNKFLYTVQYYKFD